jgi:hypothetical protein
VPATIEDVALMGGQRVDGRSCLGLRPRRLRRGERIGRGGDAGQVDTHPAGHTKPRAGADEILPARPFVQQIAKLPVADPAAPVLRAQPSLVQRHSYPRRQRLVDRTSPEPEGRRAFNPATIPGSGAEAARRRFSAARRRRVGVSATDGAAGDALKATIELR